MGRTKRKISHTAERLLEVAADLFAEKGYHSATVKEICDRARANIAAINYHFSSKKTLYIEAWRRSFKASIQAHPPDGGVPANAPAEERLQGQIAGLLHRIADKDNREFWIARREVTQPTGLLEEVIRKELHPLHERMERVVREILGKDVSAGEVRFAVMSIVSQCIDPIGMRDPHSVESPGKPALIGRDIDRFAEHIYRFSLGGLLAMRPVDKGSGAVKPFHPGKKCREKE